MSSEETPVEQPTAEETPASTEETPAATEETPATTEETPATTETTEPAADDQPAVTDVTEVTETPAEPTPEATTEEPKAEEKKEEVKQKPKKEPKPAPDYRTTKSGWVQKQGLLFKKWQRQFMTLDEEDSVLRWWKTEQRTGSDGALYMKFCVGVSDPKAETTTTWPDDTADRCFVVCSPYRAFFLVAESQEDKNDWIQKLSAAKDKHNTEGRKLITTSLISVEGIKASFDSGAADLDKTAKKEGIVEEKKTEEAAPAEGETAPAEAEGAAAVTVEVQVETPAEETPTEEPPKDETPAEEPPKEETPTEEPPKEETPAEEPPKEETPAEEPPKEETPTEEPPKEETPAEEPPKDEAPAAAEGGEETKAED